MIIKGKSRTNGRQLAAYLQQLGKNERIHILEHLSPYATLSETFRDWEILAEATQGEKYLYHAQISPEARYTMTPEQWERAADVLEKELGFTGQDRAIVLHEKDGREHAHVVWHKIDVESMTLITDSWNYLAHERASLALEKEFGHEMIPGKHAKRDRDKQPEFPRQETTEDEYQQGKRTGISPADRKAEIIALKAASDNAQSFKTALEEAGYTLARGDRGYTLVDENGDHFNLARQLKVKIAEVDTFMAEIPLNTLLPLEEAKQQAKALTTAQVHTPTQQQTQTPEQPPAQTQQPEPSKPPEPAPAPEEPSHKLTQAEILELERAVTDRQTKEAQKLKNLQSAERNQHRSVLDRDSAEKMADLDAMQEAERKRQHKKIYPERSTGMAGFIEDIKDRVNKAAAAKAKAERDQQWAALIARQEKKRADKLDSLKQDKKQELNDLDERHAQKLREQKAQSAAELSRYIREAEDARRLLAEEKERQRQLAEERTKKRDGPEPPSHTR